MNAAFLENDAEVAEFVAEFEGRTLPRERFSHAGHLLTGAWYVHGMGEARGLERMRREVRAYNVVVGGQNTATEGYHETVTVFWIKMLAGRLRESTGMSRGEFARAMFREFGEARDLLWRYYDFDVVESEQARRVWVAPTLMELR